MTKGRGLAPTVEIHGAPSLEHPVCQTCTENQFHEPVYAYWCDQIREAPRLHRKQWEFCYILQALQVHGRLRPGMRGLGFGVGLEPLAAVMAARGVTVLATDLDAEEAAAQGWAASNQHAMRLADLNPRELCPQPLFESRVSYRTEDMNAISPDLQGFDFVWSSCALEHLGSIRNGGRFILNSLETLGPGGVAVHTTEFNVDDAGPTLDHAGTVLFRRRDLEPVIARAAQMGFRCVVNWDLGDGVLDAHVDVPPYSADRHLKLQLGEFVTTSVGLIFVRESVAAETEARADRLRARQVDENDAGPRSAKRPPTGSRPDDRRRRSEHMVDVGSVLKAAGERLGMTAPRPDAGQPETVRLKAGILGARATVENRPAVVSRPGQQGVLVYGPYEERTRGTYTVDFHVAAFNPPAVLGDPICVTLDVVANDGTTVLAERRLLLSELSDRLSTFSLSFVIHQPRLVEYRVHSSGQVGLQVSREVTVATLGDATPKPTGSDAQRRAWLNEREFLDGYLRNVTGIIHVGANYGQERRYYWFLGLDVVWVEAISEMYEELVNRTSKYERQFPINALLADEDDKEFEFKIANNGGASSSILPFEDHEKLWPDIKYVESRKLKALRLETLMSRHGLSTADYQALTLDVEGAELLVLKGAGEALKGFRYVKCEVADFPSRTGTPTVDDLDAFLRAAGFAQLSRRAFAMGPDDQGTYWDIVWKRVVPGEGLQEPGIKTPMVADPMDVAAFEKC